MEPDSSLGKALNYLFKRNGRRLRRRRRASSDAPRPAIARPGPGTESNRQPGTSHASAGLANKNWVRRDVPAARRSSVGRTGVTARRDLLRSSRGRHRRPFCKRHPHARGARAALWRLRARHLQNLRTNPSQSALPGLPALPGLAGCCTALRLKAHSLARWLTAMGRLELPTIPRNGCALTAYRKSASWHTFGLRLRAISSRSSGARFTSAVTAVRLLLTLPPESDRPAAIVKGESHRQHLPAQVARADAVHSGCVERPPSTKTPVART